MLRVGLTGGLGSGKSTAAKMFGACGAYVFSADEIARELMQPGQAVYLGIVKLFGRGVVRADQTLDRGELARIAFDPGADGTGLLQQLESIVHPATISRQAELIGEVAVRDPNAVVMVESALIFETKFGGDGGWQTRFDKIIFVRSTEELQVRRFVQRLSGGQAGDDMNRLEAEGEARRRLARQAETERNVSRCDYVLQNDGSLEQLRTQVEALWQVLRDAARSRV